MCYFSLERIVTDKVLIRSKSTDRFPAIQFCFQHTKFTAGLPGNRSVFLGTADQATLGRRQALPRTAVVLVQRQCLAEIADGAIAILTDPARAQVQALAVERGPAAEPAATNPDQTMAAASPASDAEVPSPRSVAVMPAINGLLSRSLTEARGSSPPSPPPPGP